VRFRGTVGLLAALLLLAGCAGTPSPPTTEPTTEPAAEPRMSVILLQNRSDGPIGRMQLRVTNESDEDLRVDTATLESTAFAEPAVWDKGTTIPAGLTRDLPVQFPGASCADGAPETVVRIEGRTPSGAVAVEVAPSDPNERIPLLTGADCFAREVAAVGEVSLGTLRVGDPADPAELEVRVESAGSDRALRVVSIDSTVLFNPVDDSGAPAASGVVGLELGPGETSASARVPIVPNRCDPHALAEDKVGTLFVFAVEVEGGRSGSLTLPATPELRADLYEYFARACGF
jgi:hypothetical protein